MSTSDEMNRSQLSSSIQQSTQPPRFVVKVEEDPDDLDESLAPSSDFNDASSLAVKADHGHSAAEEYASRPNRFGGNPREWRALTTSERAVAASLDDLESRDLSIHLFNSFALRKRVQELQFAQSNLAGSIANELPWVPPPTWAAWPLSASEVPRDEIRCWPIDLEGEPVIRSLVPVESTRARLEGELIAHTTRTARRFFREKRKPNKQLVQSTRGRLTSRNRDPIATASHASTSRRGSLSLPNSSPSNERASDTTSPRRNRAADADDPTYSTAPLADDELARQILRPTIGHVIYQLESLLTNLHHARQQRSKESSKSPRSRSAAQSRSQEGDIAETSTAHKRARSSRRTRSPSGQLGASAAQRRGSQPPRTSNTTSRLRNWTDVLGIASMTGWDPRAIEQAASRCEALFGSKLGFATLDERPDGLGSSAAVEDDMHGAVHLDGYLQEIKARRGWRGRKKTGKERLDSRG